MIIMAIVHFFLQISLTWILSVQGLKNITSSSSDTMPQYHSQLLLTLVCPQTLICSRIVFFVFLQGQSLLLELFPTNPLRSILLLAISTNSRQNRPMDRLFWLPLRVSFAIRLILSISLSTKTIVKLYMTLSTNFSKGVVLRWQFRQEIVATNLICSLLSRAEWLCSLSCRFPAVSRAVFSPPWTTFSITLR